MRVCLSLRLVAFGLFCLLGANVARADAYGRIRGTVTDPTGAVVPKAKIVALNTATGVPTETTSGSDGDYEFLQLAAPAIYSLTAEVTGFKKAEITGIQLSLNQVFVENIQLQLGTATEYMTVSEQAITQVETTTIELGTVINSTAIMNLPMVNRAWVALMQLQTGVVAASDAHSNFSTNGSQSDQNSYLINGADNNRGVEWVRRAELNRRVQVTATKSWGPTPTETVGTEVDYQVAAPLKREHPPGTERISLNIEC